MNTLYLVLCIGWLALAATALVALAYSLPALFVLIVGWFGGVVSAVLVYQTYRLRHPIDEVFAINIDLV